MVISSEMNGLKNLNLVDCIIPRSFNNKPVYGFGYRCFHSAHSFVRAFIPNTITYFKDDVFANCSHLEEFLFEDGFKNVNLAGYTLYRTIMRSFKFPIGSTTRECFFQVSKIENVYDFMHFSDASVFDLCEQTINIYVPVNYPYDTFGERSVKKVLPIYIRHIESKGIKILCINNNLAYISPFLILLI